ncbi:heavy-metal-associated domain-containing protein [Microbacterium betulae]|uniref:Heavy-metal-associated domain-containing protein n=1 Tax=Microbacterium betulae TaxID=2981139 RepID=A0AA97FJE6_9MICO|nr:heavy-metal-associated domain-containing protein [Microbacterium sp. AB]WOF23375.1 heavy-metal-associated domain-containing protein [Microbacterium sp. AB]
MNTPARLGLYATGLAAAFGAAFLVADAVVPADAVDDWNASIAAQDGHGDAEADDAPLANGVSLDREGYRLADVAAPGEPGRAGELSFTVVDASGAAVTEYAESHEKDLHLVVVRGDGAEFRHVHPEIGADGTWSLPWTWEAAGGYRVFADFVPAAQDESITLTSTLQVAGDFVPQEIAGEVREASVDGYDVTLEGELRVGASSDLTLAVAKDGEPVTELEPYLGAFGHLVALRSGDLSYLHVHPEGADPEAGELSGPEIAFVSEAPTPGRYLLYFDFQIDGVVRSVPFQVDAGDPADDGTGTDGEAEHGTGEGHER